jgi:bacterioferritin-associated ferredoxin
VIVCLCRTVSEREIVEAIRCGARTLDDVAGRCAGAGRDCGACQTHIEHCLATESKPSIAA